MIRWNRLLALCSLGTACLGTVACDDSEDRSDGTGGSDSAGTSTGGTAGSGQVGEGGNGNSAGSAVAGSGFGQAGDGGTGAMAGGGTGGAPTCATNCNDNNPCTDDACENDVCVHRDNTADCDDGNACTSDDACSAGTCKGTNNTAACDDANDCTSDDACSAGVCQGTNNTAACDDDNECTSNDVCADGACKGTNNTAACDDLSSCTAGDQCWNGACRGALNTDLCPLCDVAGNLIQNCDFSQGEAHWIPGFFDGGAGTQVVTSERLVVDISDGSNQTYKVQPRQEPLSLKQGMKYRLSLVAGASVERDFVISLTLASAPYTIFTPGDTQAGYTVKDVSEQMKPYEFEFTVTEPDNSNVKLEIKLGGQAGNPSVVYLDDISLVELRCADAADCEDGNDCTTDTCDVGTGICSSAVRTGTCTDDGLVCTSDLCVNGKCEHEALDNEEACTDDEDGCTLDVCKAGLCTHDFDTIACDCQEDIHCDDDEPCTDDTCNVDGACSNTPNTAVCDDADVCTSNDVCAAGECGGTDESVACDTDVCTIQTACTTVDGCAAATNVCFDCTTGGNLLTNCDLSAGTTGWLEGFFDAAGTQTVENGMLVVNITGAGNEVWQVQPRQQDLVLVQNTTYVVRFNAYATVARPIIVTMTQNGGNYTSYSGPRTFNLTTEMQDLSFEFTMAAAAPGEKVKFEFDMGGPGQNPTVPNTVYLDNLFIAPKP